MGPRARDESFVATRREGRQNPVRPFLARWFAHGASLRRRVNASMNLARTHVKVYFYLRKNRVIDRRLRVRHEGFSAELFVLATYR